MRTLFKLRCVQRYSQNHMTSAHACAHFFECMPSTCRCTGAANFFKNLKHEQDQQDKQDEQERTRTNKINEKNNKRDKQ